MSIHQFILQGNPISNFMCVHYDHKFNIGEDSLKCAFLIDPGAYIPDPSSVNLDSILQIGTPEERQHAFIVVTHHHCDHYLFVERLVQACFGNQISFEILYRRPSRSDHDLRKIYAEDLFPPSNVDRKDGSIIHRYWRHDRKTSIMNLEFSSSEFCAEYKLEIEGLEIVIAAPAQNFVLFLDDGYDDYENQLSFMIRVNRCLLPSDYPLHMLSVQQVPPHLIPREGLSLLFWPHHGLPTSWKKLPVEASSFVLQCGIQHDKFSSPNLIFREIFPDDLIMRDLDLDGNFHFIASKAHFRNAEYYRCRLFNHKEICPVVTGFEQDVGDFILGMKLDLHCLIEELHWHPIMVDGHSILTDEQKLQVYTLSYSTQTGEYQGISETKPSDDLLDISLTRCRKCGAEFIHVKNPNGFELRFCPEHDRRWRITKYYQKKLLEGFFEEPRQRTAAPMETSHSWAKS